MRLLLSSIAIVLPLTAGIALAADECADPNDQSTMTLCAGKEFATADKVLNQTWHEIIKRLADDAEAKALITKAQKDWIAFRDAECAFQASDSIGGSIYPMLVTQCQTGLTNDRTAQLKTYLACEEGDMSCPASAQ